MVQEEFKMGPQGELMVENSSSGIRKGFTEVIVFVHMEGSGYAQRTS